MMAEPMLKTASVKAASTKGPSRAAAVTPEFAMSGWIVEADLADAGEPPDRRFFAVGLATADEAVEGVLRCPGLTREDPRFALRPLTPEEIAHLRLRTEAVRPYRRLMTR
jgi:hypothetical protein